MSELAFPQTSASANTKDWCGMTLRDYFAAKALQGICARVQWSYSGAAKDAYEYADEMLKARDGNS